MPRLILVFFVATASLCAQSSPLMLGVLEDRIGNYAGDPHYRSVRAVFYKDGADWKPFPTDCLQEDCLARLSADFPRETTWTIAFNGRPLGEVRTRVPIVLDSYSEAGSRHILTQGKLPTVGQPTDDFAGFAGEAVLRPLVAISQPNFKDPDLWKPVALDPSTTAIVRREFRKKYPKINDCEQEEVRDYQDSDIHVLSSYASKNRWRLVLVSLKGCDIDDLSGDGLSLVSFTIDPASTVHYLAKNLRLVDAGDYDNTGHSQLLFMIDDYNRGGYVLYSDDFQQHVTFEYSFH